MEITYPTPYGLPPGILPYSSIYGIPGFNSAASAQFQQFQAKQLAAASSAALSEPKIPKHPSASSTTSFPAKGVLDDSMKEQGEPCPRFDHAKKILALASKIRQMKKVMRMSILPSFEG
jgi:hypothetical protein